MKTKGLYYGLLSFIFGYLLSIHLASDDIAHTSYSGSSLDSLVVVQTNEGPLPKESYTLIYPSSIYRRIHLADNLLVIAAAFGLIGLFIKDKKQPNQAPEPTTTAVTPCAPSSTGRASCGRGSS